MCKCGYRQLQSLRPDPATVLWAVFAYRSNLSNLIRANLVSDGCTFRPEMWRSGPEWWHKAVSLCSCWGFALGRGLRLRWALALEASTWRFSPCRGVYMGHPNTDRWKNCFMKKLVKNNALAQFIYKERKRNFWKQLNPHPSVLLLTEAFSFI